MKTSRVYRDKKNQGASKRKVAPLSISRQHELIEENRIAARKLARNILKNWNARLPFDEVDSVADLALCEAAHRYHPSPNASFITYLFYFLKGCLVKAIRVNNSAFNQLVHENVKHDPALQQIENTDLEHQSLKRAIRQSRLEGAPLNPEESLRRKEMNERCVQALQKLSALEQRLVVDVHVLELKTTAVAKNLGYSRGHLFNLRRQAMCKMHEELIDFKEAA